MTVCVLVGDAWYPLVGKRVCVCIVDVCIFAPFVVSQLLWCLNAFNIYCLPQIQASCLLIVIMCLCLVSHILHMHSLIKMY